MHSKCRRQALEAERKELPVWAARDALLSEVRANRALIVVGETGSGKTTQIPRMLMEAGLARGGMVACTQPRRVAAITVARRVAEEMGVPIGGTVSWSFAVPLHIARTCHAGTPLATSDTCCRGFQLQAIQSIDYVSRSCRQFLYHSSWQCVGALWVSGC